MSMFVFAHSPGAASFSIILNSSICLFRSLHVFFRIYSLEGRNRRTGLIRFSQAIFKHKVTHHILLIRQIRFIQVHVSFFFISLRKADRKYFTSLRGKAFNADYSSAILSFICTLCLLPLAFVFRMKFNYPLVKQHHFQVN